MLRHPATEFTALFELHHKRLQLLSATLSLTIRSPLPPFLSPELSGAGDNRRRQATTAPMVTMAMA